MGSEEVQNTIRESLNEKEWTWQEISKHSKRESCWIYVEDDVYDVTEWVPRHPGGEDMLLLFGGRDCTQSFACYHPFTDKAHAILQKYKIGKLKGPSELVRFKPDSGFYKAVSERCAKYFKENNIDPIVGSVPYELYRVCGVIAMVVVHFAGLKLFRDWGVPLHLRLLSTVVLACASVMTALNIVHTSSHTAVFHCPKINYFLGWFIMDVLLGLSFDLWCHEHSVGHHQYTNIIELDPNGPSGDEAGFELFRGTLDQKWQSRFIYQYLWLPGLAFLVVPESRFAAFRYWLKGYRGILRISEHYLTKKSFCVFLLGKILFYLRGYALPIFIWGVPVWETIVFMFLSETIGGYIFGITLPAGHYTSDVTWPKLRKDEKTGQNYIDDEWARMQVEATKDYGVYNPILKHCFGSLNIHTPHHLFPALYFTHYQKIHPIIVQTAKEFGVKTVVVENYSDLIYDFVKNLWDMSFDTKKKE